MSAKAPDSSPVGGPGAVRQPVALEGEELRAWARDLAREHLGPRAPGIDAGGEYARDSLRLFRRFGVFDLVVPTGGQGPELRASASSTVIEEVARECGSSALMLMIQRLGALPLVLGDPDARRRAVLERLRAGDSTPAFALTEAEAGSDASGLATSARRDGEGWVIDGRKCWISNAVEADLLVVFAVTDPSSGSRGVSAFLVEADLPGVTVGHPYEKVGLRGMSAAEIVLDNVRVGGDAMLGEQGSGLKLALRTLDCSRLGVAAQATGLARAALEAAVAHGRDREQFGKPLMDHPGLAFPLAEHWARVEAGRALLTEAAACAEAGTSDAGLRASMAKLVCSESAIAATQAAVHAHGAAGYASGVAVERIARDAQVTTVYEGTSEIQRMIISRWLSKR